MNILKSLEKELEKGNKFVLSNGVILSKEKLEDKLMKDYTKAMKDGSIDIMKTSFKDFVEIETSYILDVEELLAFIVGEVYNDDTTDGEVADNVEPTDSTEESEE